LANDRETESKDVERTTLVMTLVGFIVLALISKLM